MKLPESPAALPLMSSFMVVVEGGGLTARQASQTFSLMGHFCGMYKYWLPFVVVIRMSDVQKFVILTT